MKTIFKTMATALMFLFVMAFANACELDDSIEDLLNNYDQECLSSCTYDSDCEFGLSCLEDYSYGYICMPSECEDCHYNGDACNFSWDYYGSSIVCYFNYCSY